MGSAPSPGSGRGRRGAGTRDGAEHAQKPLKTYGKSNISGGGLAKEMARVAKEMARGAKEMVRGAKEMARGAKEMEGSGWRSKEMLKNL